MKIQSLIKPSNGTVRHITVFGDTYAFMANAQGRFVADVDDEEAIACLLAHTDLYREVVEPESVAVKRSAKANRDDLLEGQ